MDYALALLRALAEAYLEVDRLREANRQLQAAYTDLKNQLEVKPDADQAAVG